MSDPIPEKKKGNQKKKPRKKKIDIKTVILVLLFVAGLLILSYPTISNKWNQYRDSKLISRYDEAMEGIDDEEIEEMLRDAENYNNHLSGEAVPDAFSIRDGIVDKTYEELLNPDGDGMMGYVSIPKIEIQLPVYHYTTDEVLEKGAGHLLGSSLPIGGESTHAVISAHRGLPSSKMFTDLNLVEEGDVFYLTILNQTLAYEVDQIETVEPEETSSLAIQKGEDYVTLVTCTPYAVNSHRLLVRGHRTTLEAAEAKEGETTVSHGNPTILMTILCIILGILIALGLVAFLKRKELKAYLEARKSGAARPRTGSRSTPGSRTGSGNRGKAGERPGSGSMNKAGDRINREDLKK